jgi:2-iminobutanoate/2-iminopropanoate deaminase
MKKRIHTDKAPAPVGPYTQAIRSGDLLFVSGQIALDPATGDMKTETIEIETDQVLRNIGEILRAAGIDFSAVIKCSVFILNMDHYGQVNKTYEQYFAKSAPARELVEVARLPKDANIEISCIATFDNA